MVIFYGAAIQGAPHREEAALLHKEFLATIKGAGFEVGDIILEINSQAIDSLDGFMGLVNTLKSGQKMAVLALDHRTGNSGYVEIVVK